MRKLLTKVLGDPSAKAVKKLQPRIEEINQLEPGMKKKSDAALKKQTELLRKHLQNGKSLDDILPEAFATVREAARRAIGQRHYDVQLLGGMALHQGSIAEMRTGEGKTIMCTLAVYLNALEQKGVHVVTVNDYLAQRDGGWMGQIYHFLGLSTGVIISGNRSLIYDPDYQNTEHDDERLMHLKPIAKTAAYAADITYGTNNEFGFDYLRDNMVGSKEERSQRPLNFAIVDEVDSILIDEARTPLIISAPSSENATNYQQFSKVARQLNPESDYVVDEKLQAVTLTDEGIEHVEKILGVANIYDSNHVRDIYHLEQALRAESLFKRDKDYVVREGEVIIARPPL
jgi:preprotein translocase subunit SecA